MSETFKQAGKVISYFHHAPAQHALLRRYQVELYGKEMALLNSVATRWGSQYTMLQSINRTYKALCAWADKQEESGDSEITQIILDSSFRLRLEGVIGVLGPVHQAQKRSEAQGFSVFEVVRQWLAIASEVRRRAKRTHFEQEICSFLEGRFKARMERQVAPLHWAAYYMLPEISSMGKEIPSARRAAVKGVIEKYSGKDAIRSFFEYYQREGAFADPSLWRDLSPKAFWMEAVSISYIT
jgi:hypothetical protein